MIYRPDAWELTTEYQRRSAGYYRAMGDRSALAFALFRLGTSETDIGDYGRAIASLSESADLSIALGQPSRHASALLRLARVYEYFAVDEQKALDLLREAAAEAGRAGAAQDRVEALGGVARIYRKMG